MLKIGIVIYLIMVGYIFHSSTPERVFNEPNVMVNYFKRVPFVIKEVPPKIKVKEIDPKQITCMRDNILNEAGIENEYGKIAVALVTMNRTKDKKYPKTICGVVYDHKQFSWTIKGSQKYSKKQKRRAYLLAKYSIIGYNDNSIWDYTDGSLFYHADYVKPYWVNAFKKTIKVDTHIFYKRK